MFERKVISAELFGGTGSVIHVYLEDGEKMKRIDLLTDDFLKLTVKSVSHKNSRLY